MTLHWTTFPDRVTFQPKPPIRISLPLILTPGERVKIPSAALVVGLVPKALEARMLLTALEARVLLKTHGES